MKRAVYAFAANVLAFALSPVVAGLLGGLALGALAFGDDRHAIIAVCLGASAATQTIAAHVLTGHLQRGTGRRLAGSVRVYVSDAHDCPTAGQRVRHVSANVEHSSARLSRAAFAATLTHIADRVEAADEGIVEIETAPWT